MTNPAWINRAAEAIVRGVREFGWDAEDVADIATIISKHAPQPKPLEWAYAGNGEWVAHTPFGDYRAENDGWDFEADAYTTRAYSLEVAKAAAFADFCDKIKACYGEARE